MSTNATCLDPVGPFYELVTWPWLGAIGARSSERQTTQFQWMATACNLGWAGVWWGGVGRIWCVWQASGAWDTLVIRVSHLPAPNLQQNLTRSKTTPKFRPKFTTEFRHSLRPNFGPLAPKTPHQSLRTSIKRRPVSRHPNLKNSIFMKTPKSWTPYPHTKMLSRYHRTSHPNWQPYLHPK